MSCSHGFISQAFMLIRRPFFAVILEKFLCFSLNFFREDKQTEMTYILMKLTMQSGCEFSQFAELQFFQRNNLTIKSRQNSWQNSFTAPRYLFVAFGTMLTKTETKNWKIVERFCLRDVSTSLSVYFKGQKSA